MKRIIIATAAGAALLAGVTAASAQSAYYDGGYYGPRDRYVERNVGLQVGPVGIGVYAEEPAYAPSYGYRSDEWRGDNSNSTYNMRAFRSQEYYPQSPPGGGY